MEGNLAVVHQFRFRESFVPLLGKIQCAHILVCVWFAGKQCQGCNGNCGDMLDSHLT